MLDESPLSRVIAVLEVCARWKITPPSWAVARWAKTVPVVHWVRALAVLKCSGNKRRNKFDRAERVLQKINPHLFAGLSIVASAKTIKKSYVAVGKAQKKQFRGEYRYLGVKSCVEEFLPLLAQALEQPDSPHPPFFW